MKFYKLKALIIWGLFLFIFDAQSEVVYKDKIVYKVGRSIFTINDLKNSFEDMKNLDCIYDDSLLNKVFESEFKRANTKFLTLDPEFSNAKKVFLRQLIQFHNLLVYSRSQSVVINPNVTKFFYLTAKQRKCDLKSFEDSKNLTKRFKEIVRLEVFLRSRFLPTDKGGRTTQKDFIKAITSVRNLLKSVGRQIENEFYW